MLYFYFIFLYSSELDEERSNMMLFQEKEKQYERGRRVYSLISFFLKPEVEIA